MELKRCKKAPRPWQMRFGFEGPAFARRANAQPLGCIPGLALVRPFPAFKRKGTLLMLLLLLLLLLLVLLLLLLQQQQLALLLFHVSGHNWICHSRRQSWPSGRSIGLGW